MWTVVRNFGSTQLVFIRWLAQILRRGYERSLDEEDLRSIPVRDNGSTLHATVEMNWKEVLSRNRLRVQDKALMWATLKSFNVVIILCVVLRVFDTCFLLTLERILLGDILQRLVTEPEADNGNVGDNSEFRVITVSFALLGLFRLILGGLYYYVLEQTARKMRIGLTALVHSKLLRLSQRSLREIGAGGVINLVSNDGAKFENAYEICTVFIGPLQLCSLTWIVWTHFGGSSIAGLVAIVLMALAQSYMGKIGTKYRAKVAAASSHRVKLVTQIVTAIRTIKMYAWEIPFTKLVSEARRKELELIRRSHLLRTIGWCLYSCTSTLAMFSTIICYLSTTGEALTAEKVFVCTTIYQNIGVVLNVDFPKGLAQLGILVLTFSRFQDFLLLEENPVPKVIKPRPSMRFKKPRLFLQDVSVQLSHNSIWSSVNLKVNSGEFVAIVGNVGSGKSTLFNAILKEVPISSGLIQISGRIAYAPQQPWLFRGTIRENILFGNAYRMDYYEKVIHACALTQDLYGFPQGDQTIVAEDGVSLSGGQKARISLARAVYSNADIYLLDDTLSAVDQKVGQHLVTFCLFGLLKYKVRLLITHQLHLLPEVNRVLKVDAGAISSTDYDQSGASKVDYFECDEDMDDHKVFWNEKYFDHLNGNRLQSSAAFNTSDSSSVYRKYFCASPKSFKYLAAFLMFTLIVQASQAGENYFLKFCVSSDTGFQDWAYSSQLAVSLSVILMALLTSAQHSSSFIKIVQVNSVTIYDSLFLSVLNAPIQFFTAHSAGYVIERFARDTFVLDEVFPFSIFYASYIFQKYVTSLLLFLATSLHTLMILPSVVLLQGVYFFQQFQIRSCRSLNQLELGVRESIVSHLNSTFHGLTTVRAFRKQREMEFQFRNLLDFYFYVNFTKLSVICLTSVAIDFLSLATVNIFIMITVFSSESRSSVGFGIVPLITLTHAIGWAASQFHVIESQAKSVESIVEIMEVESEESSLSDVDKHLQPPADWPRKGKITFEDVNLSHQEGNPVLKNVNFTIYPGEQIAIIGRTGAGKSSLVSALFRLPEPTGRILIDGLNILDISLKDLRPRISIIPQDPVLFEGTVRTNLDPFGEFDDDALIQSLDNVSLGYLNQSCDGLNLKIQEGGKSLSVGERQLLCMARALLRKNKILVLDEATANVDLETSRLIQNKICEVFANCTVLTVQHRLTSILEYDRVIVMDSGEIIEFDTPQVLLRDPAGYLSKRLSGR